MDLYTDEYFMKEALVQARLAFDLGEVPVGAVVVGATRILGKGYNLTQRLNDVTAHAEMQAITAACDALGGKYLWDCTLYVTLEPCIMCAGALFWTQISRVVYGAHDPRAGFQRSTFGILHPKTQVVGGLLREPCAELLQNFFVSKR